MSVKVTLTCHRHPQYKAKRMPQAECYTCWDIYNVLHSRLTSHHYEAGRLEVKRHEV